MQLTRRTIIQFLKLFVFWILLFDFQRVLFSIHNWNKFSDVGMGEWFMSFVYSIRLDMSTAAYLSVLPLLALSVRYVAQTKWSKWLFYGVLMGEVVIISMIHAGEINAYTEWNHKLTSRVFTHLSNPDEVVRTADYSMTFWFAVYTILEVVFAWRMYRWILKEKDTAEGWNRWVKAPVALGILSVFTALSFLVARGGWQPIPINIDSAYYSNSHVANDLSVNSAYFFMNSYLLYNRSEIDDLLPEIDPKKAQGIVKEMYSYERNHDNYILKDQRPNVVFIIMESWASGGIGCLSDTKGATPNFDKLAKEGLLFTNLYSTGHTSEIGNSSIFSGYPAIPEISISLQPEKHRQLRSLNQDFKEWGYSSHYIFSGDLKYGNIGGYFMDHGFDDVSDEKDFPKNLERGKLNYYDADLYKILIDRINKTEGKFMHCAFTGSTHSPFDQPYTKAQNWSGAEPDFMNSMIYADACLKDFIRDVKKQKWYDNTIFVFVADHGHATPLELSASSNYFYRIPMLIWGKPLKKEYRGEKVDKLGSQADIAATLLYQMGAGYEAYPWSKDLLNPESPEFALHTVIGGYGWVTPKGGMSYEMNQKHFIENTFPKDVEKEELDKGYAFLNELYRAYKDL